MTFGGVILTQFFLGSLIHGLYEPHFISRNAVVEDLAKKYNFSVFDFALAKKESHLKELRNELVSQSNHFLYGS
jgi:hypothetical protein